MSSAMLGVQTAVALLLLAAAAHVSSFGAQASLITGYKGLGDGCYYDEECDTTTTYCRERRSCSCKERFRETEGRCVATVGARCTSIYDCTSLPDSECKDEECMCREGHVRSSDYNHCLPVVTMYKGDCEEDEQCQLSFGDYAWCRDTEERKICRCRDGYHYPMEQGKCINSKGLGDSCAGDYDCSYDEDERHKVRCHNGECICRDGYRRDDRVCVDGAAQATVSIIAFVVMLLVRIL